MAGNTGNLWCAGRGNSPFQAMPDEAVLQIAAFAHGRSDAGRERLRRQMEHMYELRPMAEWTHPVLLNLYHSTPLNLDGRRFTLRQAVARAIAHEQGFGRPLNFVERMNAFVGNHDHRHPEWHGAAAVIAEERERQMRTIAATAMPQVTARPYHYGTVPLDPYEVPEEAPLPPTHSLAIADRQRSGQR